MHFVYLLVLGCAFGETNLPPQCRRESYSGPAPTLHEWNAIDGDGEYEATPSCFDEDYRIVRRSCFNGAWYPKRIGNCYDFVCPKPFTSSAKGRCSYTTDEEICPDLPQIASCTENCTRRNCTYNASQFDELELPSYVIDVTLSFSDARLKLVVYRPEASDETLTPRCYTNDVDAGVTRNRKSVNASKIYDSRSSEIYARFSLTNFTVHVLDLDEDPKQYWCHVFETSKFRPVTTGRVVAHRRKTGNEHSLRVSVFDFAVEDILRNFCPRCRLLEILHADKSGRRVATLHLDDAEDFLNATGKGVRILSYKSAEHCPPEVTVSGKKLLHWKRTPIGTTSSFCNDHATRRCLGGFLEGAEWGDVRGECLDEDPVESQKRGSHPTLVHGFDFAAVKNFALYRRFQNLPGNSSFTDLSTTDDLQLAVFLPEETKGVVTTVFTGAAEELFRDDRTNVTAASNVVGISISGADETYLELPVFLVFKARGSFKETACGFWDGRWSTVGGDRVATLGENHTVCAFSRLGNFALLALSGEKVIWDDRGDDDGGVEESDELRRLILIACVLAAVGVVVGVGVIVVMVVLKKQQNSTPS